MSFQVARFSFAVGSVPPWSGSLPGPGFVPVWWCPPSAAAPGSIRGRGGGGVLSPPSPSPPAWIGAATCPAASRPPGPGAGVCPIAGPRRIQLISIRAGAGPGRISVLERVLGPPVHPARGRVFAGPRGISGGASGRYLLGISVATCSVAGRYLLGIRSLLARYPGRYLLGTVPRRFARCRRCADVGVRSR